MCIRDSLRHAPPRGRCGPAGGPGNAWPRRYLDDADLHPCRPGIPAHRAQAVSSPRLAMILVIDNYASFTYNLVQYLGELGADPVVRRNDEVTVDDVGSLSPRAIVLSPGPCTPAEAGVTVPVIRRWGASIPTLGVC